MLIGQLLSYKPQTTLLNRTRIVTIVMTQFKANAVSRLLQEFNTLTLVLRYYVVYNVNYVIIIVDCNCSTHAAVIL